MSGHGRVVRVAATALCTAVLFGLTAAASTVDDVALLLFGTVRLGDTDVALTAEQAGMLVPVVQTWRQELSRGKARMTVSFNKIKAILTAEQLSRIRAMHLAASDIERWIECTLDLDPCGCGMRSMMGRTPRSPFPLERIGILHFADQVISLLREWATGGP